MENDKDEIEKQRDAFTSFKMPTIKLSNDIYSLAYACFLDPDQLEEPDKFMPVIRMNDDEVMNIFLGAVMVILSQLTMIGLIVVYERTSDTFEIIPSNSFLIILARFMSSMMMHLNVEPEIRSGLMLAKYVVNHPNRFKGTYTKNSKGGYDINYSRICPPLFLALSQTFVGLIVEINVLIYLTSLKSLLDVIMKFVTLASICKFDDMYAASLFENKMKAAAGKKLKKYYYRRHGKHEERIIHDRKKDDDFQNAVLNNSDDETQIFQTDKIDY